MLVQVDDATGEVLQDVAERLHAAGARNLQVLASLGKKGRPGHVLLVDVDASLEERIALILGLDLGVWGYRVLESRHRHFDITSTRRRLRVRLPAVILEEQVGIKEIRAGERLVAVKAEHADLVRVRDAALAQGVTVGVRVIRAATETAARTSGGDEVLEVDLCEPPRAGESASS